MYKCLDCGQIFDDGEEENYKIYKGTHTNSKSPAYSWNGCPVCGGVFERTMRCQECKSEHLRSELYADRWCSECLTEKLTYDSFLEYATSDTIDTESGMLEHFMFIKMFNFPERYVPSVSSAKFKRVLREWYLRMVANEKLIGDGELIDTIRDYALDTESDKEDFAQWIAEREAK